MAAYCNGYLIHISDKAKFIYTAQDKVNPETISMLFMSGIFFNPFPRVRFV